MKQDDEVGAASAETSPSDSLAPASATATPEAVTCENIERRDRWTPPFALEALAGLCLAGFALFHLALHMQAMATTGL